MSLLTSVLPLLLGGQRARSSHVLLARVNPPRGAKVQSVSGPAVTRDEGPATV